MKKRGQRSEGRELIPWQKIRSIRNMKELRIQCAGKPYRICFVFDPRQTGILLIGGIKSGKSWTQKIVAAADKIYDSYLAELKKEGLL
ncbi:MAG TPA: type II toxin-antitoxin system RelE/ParE family toxin [Candidatus Acidoferrales bacterium]|nr:type II toxin-antitoxin system RelE/ParE family toxin [Candidatus Acidoferrales bacterium]